MPNEVNVEIWKKAIVNDEVIICHPADLHEPELDKIKPQCIDIAKTEAVS